MGQAYSPCRNSDICVSLFPVRIGFRCGCILDCESNYCRDWRVVPYAEILSADKGDTGKIRIIGLNRFWKVTKQYERNRDVLWRSG